jgi:hypothetical protein
MVLIFGELLEGVFNLNYYSLEALQFFIILHFIFINLNIECFYSFLLVFGFLDEA